MLSPAASVSLRAVLVTLVLAAGALASAQKEPDFDVRQKQLRGEVKAVLGREEARQKENLCADAPSNAQLNGCLRQELSRTEQNYKDLVLRLGALIRLGMQGAPAARPGRLTFDDAETTWVSYRSQACDAVGEWWTTGTGRSPAIGRCVLQVTRDHMRELVQIHSAEMEL